MKPIEVYLKLGKFGSSSMFLMPAGVVQAFRLEKGKTYRLQIDDDVVSSSNAGGSPIRASALSLVQFDSLKTFLCDAAIT